MTDVYIHFPAQSSQAVLAQLVERKALNLVVQGSSPWDGDKVSFSLHFRSPFSVYNSVWFFFPWGSLQ